MKDKSYTLLELRKLYSAFLCDKEIPHIVDAELNIRPFIHEDFLIWLRKKEASTPDFEKKKTKFIVVNDITYQRTTGDVYFWCCCGEDIRLCRGDDIKECECGRKYRFARYVEVKEK